MKRWLADTLFKRLFLLIWTSLVFSHFAAFTVVGFFERGNASFFERVPTLPSLPPTPGLGARPPGGPPPPRDGGPGAGPGPWPGPDWPGERGPRAGGPPGLSGHGLLLDYGIRLLIIAAAAWWGARWLSQPMRRLMAASSSLGGSLDGVAGGSAAGSLGGSGVVRPLDEAHGTVEVREAARVFNALAERLRQYLSARSLMVAAISHDLRTPMTRIRMRLEQSPDESLVTRSIADLREMDDLIDSALVVFRGQEAAEPAQRTDVFALVQSLVDDLAELGQPVSLTGDAVSAVTQVQPTALKRVLSNLIGNALRYGERADLSLERNEHAIVLHIDDTGPGIPDAMIDAVMQPFFRLDASRRRSTGGSGLGLYIARDLLARQGGSLRLANRGGGGLRATLTLPC